MKQTENFPYWDILDLPHHQSLTRPRMSMEERAAQFAPFAALTGHEAALAEAEQLTIARMEAADRGLGELDEFHLAIQQMSEHMENALRYFHQNQSTTEIN